MKPITCYIYRCSAKQDMYIYLKDRDDFGVVPPEVLKNLGRTDFAMELELSADTRLAREDPTQVMENLQNRGFHLQMPSDMPTDELLEKITRQITENAGKDPK